MAVTTFSEEHTSPISPARIFKASIVDSHNLIPKIMPQAIKNIEIIQGNGGAGSSHFGSLKYHIDELNEETFTYNYTFIEGGTLTDKHEKITYEVKFEPTPEGGSVSKVTRKYHTKDDFVLKEDEIRAGKEKVLGMYKVVEA